MQLEQLYTSILYTPFGMAPILHDYHYLKKEKEKAMYVMYRFFYCLYVAGTKCNAEKMVRAYGGKSRGTCQTNYCRNGMYIN